MRPRKETKCKGMQTPVLFPQEILFIVTIFFRFFFDSSLDEVTVITMFVTVGFVVVLGFLMHSLVSVESERVMNEQAEQTAKRRRSQASKTGQEATEKVQADRYIGGQ